MEFDQKKTEAWITRIKEGDEVAFQEFYEEWFPKTFYIALAITHHEADAKDVAQETMIEVHKSIHNLRDVKYFKLWLNRIVLSKCNRIFRKPKAITMDMEQREALMMKEEERSEFLPSEHIRHESDMEVLQQLLGKISPIYAEVLVLMYYEQCSIKEISAILQVPEGTVKSRLNSAKLKLKEEISAYEEREHIKLNFHEEAFGVLLPLVYSALLKKSELPVESVKPTKPAAKKNSFLTSNVLIASLCCLIAFCCFGIVTSLNHSGDQEAWDNTDIEEITKIEPVLFKNVLIENDRDAYFMLMKYAHCEYERKQLAEAENKIADELIQALQKRNSKYYTLWMQRK